MKFLLHKRKAFSGGWDLSKASADGYFTVQYNSMDGFYMKSDGMRLFIIKSMLGSGYIIQQYDLSTAWDVTTAKSPKYITVMTSPSSIVFNSDGTVMYIGDYVSGGSIFQYDLSTGWKLDTASYNQTIDVSGTVSDAAHITFSANGTKLYVKSNTNDSIYQFSLSTPFDISTNSYDSKSFSVYTKTTTSTGLTFKNDGSIMYVASLNDGKIYQYNLSTAWDISTALYDTNHTIGSTLYSISFKPDGKIFYALRNDSVYQYNLS